MRSLRAILLISCAVLHAGSGAPALTTNPIQPERAQGAALRGRVHGGQQPIVGASVYAGAARSPNSEAGK